MWTLILLIIILLIIILAICCIISKKSVSDTDTDTDTEMDIIKRMLKDTLVVLNKYDIQYWADYGTLLGLHRQGDLIPDDDDADLCIKNDQEDALINPHLQKELNNRGLVMVRSINMAYKIYRISDVPKEAMEKLQYYCGECPHIDIFIWFDKGQCTIRDCNKSWGEFSCWRGIRRDDTPSDLFHMLERVYYPKLGSLVGVPVKREQVLEHRYGKDWTVPKPGFKGIHIGC